MKRGTPNHPKVLQLAELLGIRRPLAIGHLELLFHFTSQYTPQGDIGKYDDKRIAAGLDWCGSPQKLIDALITTRWLCRHSVARLVVHGWNDHADRSVLQRLAREKKTVIECTHSDTDNPCTQSETNNRTCLALPVPKPVPKPLPNGQRVPIPSQSRLREFWIRYSSLRDAGREDWAGRAWISYSCEEHADDVLTCLTSYEQSRDVFTGAIQNADKWLQVVFESGFKARWPPPKGKPKTVADELMEEAMENDRRNGLI